MALIVEDRIAETSTSTGTGDFTLAGAITGFRAFSAVCSTSDTCYYVIETIDGSGVPTGEWETGLGTYSATDTLTRTTVSRSSNAHAAVNFAAGTKRVMISRIAAQQSFRGALVKKDADQTGANYTSATAVAWNAESYDTDSFHDNSTNNTRLTIPAGVTKVRLSGSVRVVSHTADQWVIIAIQKNGSSNYDGVGQMYSEIGGLSMHVSCETAILDVVEGDYFEFALQVESDTSIDIAASRSWFAIEVIEAEPLANYDSRYYTEAEVDALLAALPGEGTSFPGSPATGDRFYRTDRNIEYFYDGTRWLSTQLFTIHLSPTDLDMPFTTSTAGHVARSTNPWNGKYDIYAEEISYWYVLTGVGNWDVVVGAYDIGTLATYAGLTSTAHVNGRTALNQVLSNATLRYFYFNFTENSGTANFYFNAAITYRLVG